LPVAFFLAFALTAYAEPAAVSGPALERLTRAARLWGDVRYLHPYVVSREVDWDRAFVDALVPRVHLRASNGSSFVTAAGGGGGDVRADKLAAAPWETFHVVVLSGGPLVSGDRVALQTFDGAHYLQAVAGGGAGLRATATQIGAFETFIVEKPDGGAIRDGDAVRFRSSAAPWYISAESGGGSGLTVNRPSAGAWETFTILFAR
jgi:hypothetical protein